MITEKVCKIGYLTVISLISIGLTAPSFSAEPSTVLKQIKGNTTDRVYLEKGAITGSELSTVSIQLPNEATSTVYNVYKNNAYIPTPTSITDVANKVFYPEDLTDNAIYYNISDDYDIGGAVSFFEGEGDNARINADFVGNSTTSYGGAIYNEIQIDNIVGNFIGNYAVSNEIEVIGGAIENYCGTINSITGDFIGNYTSSDIGAYAGAIDNFGGAIGTITGNFVSNHIYAENNYAFGGAIDNYTQINNIVGDFIGNHAISTNGYIVGGAIDNAGQINSIVGNFIGNYGLSINDSVYGGALANYEGITKSIKGNFINNHAISENGEAYGGVIYNGDGEMGEITGDFISNYALSKEGVYGGAICNLNSKLSKIIGNFTENYANSSNGSVYGGAINNYEGTIDSIIGDFTGNYITSDNGKTFGGAIYNFGTINNITGKFSNNNAKSFSSSNGGAILNSGNLGKIAGDFTGNHVVSTNGNSYGGAIDNSGTIKNLIGNFVGNYVSAINGNAFGSTIYNSGTINNITGNFINNYGVAEKGQIYGGAINNASTIENIKGDFIGNYVSSTNKKAYGGAIYNSNVISNLTGNFVNNYAVSTKAQSYGGAIYNSGNIDLVNTNFSGNNASSGGAIYNDGGTMSFKGNTVFKENTVTTGNGGAICNANNTINLNGNTLFENNIANGKLNDIYNNANININGKTTLHGGIEGLGITKIANGVTIKPLDNYAGVVNMQQADIYFGNSSTIDMRNNVINNIDFGNSNIHIADNLNLYLDANLETEKIDTISSTGTVNTLANSSINIQGIKVIKDAVENTVTTNTITNNPNILAITNYIGDSSIDGYSPLYKYDVTFNENGSFTFKKSADSINPAVISPAIAANVGSYSTALNSYDNGFNGLDNLMSMTSSQRFALKHRNTYAFNELSGLKYDENGNKGIWFNPYATFENVKLNNGPNVSSVSYGSFIGGDSEIQSFKNGWDAIFSLFTGYTGSHQNYNDVGIFQNGGALGSTATFYKGNYFVGSTINVGASNAQANNMHGHEEFSTLNSGIAMKTGYNFEFKEGLFILQPSLLMSYTFVNTFDYTNAAGAKMSSKPMHAINLAPGVKFVWNLKDGWQPYLSTRMFWNIMDQSSFTASYAENTVTLPQMSIDPYFQYGVGVKKKWGEKLTGFAQAMLNAGGRNGVALQFGFKIKLGKESV